MMTLMILTTVLMMNDDTDDGTDDGGRGNLYTIAYSETLILDLVQP